MNAREVLSACKEEKVRFLRLQFTDIMGSVKNVEVPESQFEKALDGQVLFDGSSIEGFARIEESDMLRGPTRGPSGSSRGRGGRGGTRGRWPGSCATSTSPTAAPSRGARGSP